MILYLGKSNTTALPVYASELRCSYLNGRATSSSAMSRVLYLSRALDALMQLLAEILALLRGDLHGNLISDILQQHGEVVQRQGVDRWDSSPTGVERL